MRIGNGKTGNGVTRASCRAGRECGVALLIVLWASVLLSAIVATYALLMHTEQREAASYALRVQSTALAEAGIHRAIHGLLEAPPESGWRLDGEMRSFELSTGTVQVRVFAETGRIDLNRAPVTLLEGLARVGGAEHPAKVAARIMDWRDKDAEPRDQGAEDAQYRQAGFTVGAADRPFRSTAELHQILDLSPSVAVAMGRLSTVYNRSGRVDPTVASPAVLGALPNMSEDAIQRHLDNREIAQLANGTNSRSLRASARMLAPKGFFAIEARGVTAAGSSATSGVTVLLTRVPARPFVVLVAKQDFAW
ncbi:MAG: hypothetical protein HOI95_19805 [Chromatiales bacterium]|jgi:general secretion pathway protein K|nr:hypothetical protein [Chromatiales bacterium]